MQETRRQDIFTWGALAFIIAAGAFLRLHDLGLSAFRGDTILLKSLAESRVAPFLLFTKWFEVSGAAGQMPMPAFVMQAFLGVTGIALTPAAIRFPYALFGILSVAAAFWAGRSFAGRGFGLFYAALFALNPFHVYYSREAYFYSALMFGYTLYFWSAVLVSRRLWNGEAVTRREAVLLGLALFFTAWSQMSGLLLCFAGGVCFLVLLLRFQKGTDAFWKNIRMLAVPHVVVLLPLLLFSWGPRQFLDHFTSGNKDMGAKVVELAGETFAGFIPKLIVQFSWGFTWWGLPLIALAALGLAWAFWKMRSRELWLLAYFIVSQVLLFAVTRAALGSLYESRYIAGMFPFFLALLTFAVYSAPRDLLGRMPIGPVAPAIAAVLCAAALAGSAYPAYVTTQLTGKPAPYYDIVSWCDGNLPPGTPVLVDRWFEPWNELKAHPAEKVAFTFVIPNEPIDVFKQHNWRAVAQQFLNRYPDAAYLELAKTYWEAPEIGAWQWPRRYFKRHVAFTNEAGLKLRHWGLATRGDFYAATTNRTIVDLFYNLPEDVFNKAREEKVRYLALYGSGWKYTKPFLALQGLEGPAYRAMWEQVMQSGFRQVYMDWRVLEEGAELILCNTSAQPGPAKLVISGVTLTGTKQVKAANGETKSFPPGQRVVWEIGPIELQPGQSPWKLRDPLWSLNTTPLLVEQVSLQPAEPAHSR